MAEHRRSRRPSRPARTRSTGRRRAVVARRGRATKGWAALALAGGLVLGAGSQGTFAFWSDTDTVASGSFTTGRLDLTVDGAQGNPTAYAATNLALATMVPGESVAATLTVRNAGDAPFTFRASATKAGDLATPLVVEVLAGSTQTGDDATYPRTEGCSGGTPLSPTTATRLDVAASTTLCVKVTLPFETADTFQSKTAPSTVSLALAASQVAP